MTASAQQNEKPPITVRREESRWAVHAVLRFLLALVVVVGHCCSLVSGSSDWTFIGLWLNQGSAVFYRRRMLRIWPLYIGCIAFGLIVSLRIPNGFTWPTGVKTLDSNRRSDLVAERRMVALHGCTSPAPKLYVCIGRSPWRFDRLRMPVVRS